MKGLFYEPECDWMLSAVIDNVRFCSFSSHIFFINPAQIFTDAAS